MQNIETPWTKTGVTAREITTQVGGPSRLKRDLTVPAGTSVHFIGHWVVGDLRWLATSVGNSLIAEVPSIGLGKSAQSVGLGSIEYHDADHYGIVIAESDVVGIREVKH